MENRNISIASKNGYTYEKVMKAKQYLEEIGTNKRFFPFEKLVTYYNDILGTHDSTSGCKCQAPKYYNGINNYFKYGKLTLINNGLASESDFEMKEPETEPVDSNRIDLGLSQENVSESVSDAQVKDDKEEENKASQEAENGVKEVKKAGRPKKK